jgi:hypothetical protein
MSITQQTGSADLTWPIVMAEFAHVHEHKKQDMSL